MVRNVTHSKNLVNSARLLQPTRLHSTQYAVVCLRLYSNVVSCGGCMATFDVRFGCFNWMKYMRTCILHASVQYHVHLQPWLPCIPKWCPVAARRCPSKCCITSWCLSLEQLFVTARHVPGSTQLLVLQVPTGNKVVPVCISS